MRAKSYEMINYNLRPAKSIERKMLCETFSKLLNIFDVTKYRYVGFGSTFFTDFSLIHKSLGLNDLVSIEKEEEDKNRFRFNCPYKCIRLLFGDANDVLPNMSWSKKIILWLDYDYKIKESMFADIGIFISRAQSGSLLLLTMDVTTDDLNNPGEKSRCDQLLDRIGSIKMPLGISDDDLNPRNYPRTCYKIINSEIDESLSRRNGGLENKLIYKQLFNFLYRDGSAPMLTIGGIIYAANDEDKIKRCNFEGLEFIKPNRHVFDPYRIIVPNLTFREMRYLDKWLPSDRIRGIDRKADTRFLSNDLINNYSKIYRYFPNFVEAEMR